MTSCLTMLRVLCLLGIMALVPGMKSLMAQAHNGLVYQQLLETFFEQDSTVFGSVDGELIPAWLPTVPLDSNLQRSLYISAPEITYQKISASYYSRQIDMVVSISDTAFRSDNLQFRDSMSLSQLRDIRKVSPFELKGDPPTFFARAIRPVAVVMVSVAAVVGLFYARSR